MLACLTANINRAEKAEPFKHNIFLRYPTVDMEMVDRLSPEAVVICLSVVPTVPMAELLIGIKDVLVGTYIWGGDRWMYL